MYLKRTLDDKNTIINVLRISMIETKKQTKQNK